MPDSTVLTIYLGAAFVLAITPGPGMLYVLTRSLKGGRNEGYASSLGTAIGGLFHVIAAAVGLSTILATSALAFSIVKYVGAAYLIYLGVRTIFSHNNTPDLLVPTSPNSIKALRQGVLTEMLNPKTALFFLAFIPQFVNPEGVVFVQFLVLGCISVFMNTAADVLVATFAGPIGNRLAARPNLRRGQRMFTGTGLMALGAYVALASD